MGLDIDQDIQDIPILAIPPADRFLIPADQAPVRRLQRMHHHNFSSEGTRSGESTIGGCLLTPFQTLCYVPLFALAESSVPTPCSRRSLSDSSFRNEAKEGRLAARLQA